MMHKVLNKFLVDKIFSWANNVRYSIQKKLK